MLSVGGAGAVMTCGLEAAIAATPVHPRTATVRWVTRRLVTTIADQYRTIATGAGWVDRSSRGRLRFEGRDVLSFLHAIVTNQVEGLERGAGIYAALLTPQGRMVSDLRVYQRGTFVLVDVPPGLGSALASRFDLAVFAEDVRVHDASADWTQIGVAGTDAGRLIAAALGGEAAALATLRPLGQVDLPGMGEGFVVRTDDAVLPTFDVIVPVAWRADVLARLTGSGAVAMSDEIAHILRIEAARPAFGIDMTDETIPLEAGLLDRAISTSKGCYVGQEVIVRVLHRGGGRVVKRLVSIALDGGPDDVPAAGCVLTVDGRDVGRITSAGFSPGRGRIVALAYVHRDHAEVGRLVETAAPGCRPGAITAFAG